MIDALEAASGRPVSRETFGLLTRYVECLRAAATEQNLIAQSTVATIWERHILDCAQLVRFEPRPGSSWVDIGSGAGLPGLVVAILVAGRVTLLEPRRLRAEFLASTTATLGLADRVRVEQARVERAQGCYDVLTGRAVARLGKFLDLSHHLSTGNSLWVLPKGRSAESELAEAQRNWHCMVETVPSSTDPDARILVLTGVGKRRR